MDTLFGRDIVSVSTPANLRASISWQTPLSPPFALRKHSLGARRVCQALNKSSSSSKPTSSGLLISFHPPVQPSRPAENTGTSICSGFVAAALTDAGHTAETSLGGVRTDADASQVGQVALAAGVPLTELRPADGAGLEEMFLELTASSQREGVAA